MGPALAEPVYAADEQTPVTPVPAAGGKPVAPLVNAVAAAAVRRMAGDEDPVAEDPDRPREGKWGEDAGAEEPEPELAPQKDPEVARAEAKQVLAYIKTEAAARAAEPRSVDPGSMFYQRLTDHYLKEYLAKPSPQAGERAIQGISKPMTGAIDPKDYWEKSASGWEHQSVPRALRMSRPGIPAELGAATDILRLENRAKLPYLDVPQLVGEPNADADEDADWLGGGKNVSQLMHWASGVKFSGMDKGTMRDLFLAYEMFHLEGWDVFGEDPINDMIAEDAGQLLGRELRSGAVNAENLQAKLDEGFAEARAWVGTLLRGRQGALDAWILAEQPVPARGWWKEDDLDYVWGEDTIFKLLVFGHTLEQVCAHSFVEHIVEIYTLIPESTLWEQKHGVIENSGFIQSMLSGELDGIFAKLATGKAVTSKDAHQASGAMRGPKQKP